MFCTQKMMLVVAHIKGGQCRDEVVPSSFAPVLPVLSVDSTSRKHLCVPEAKVTVTSVLYEKSAVFFFLNCLKIGKSLCLSMHDYIGFKMYLWLLFVLACVGSCVLSCTCGDHGTASWSWFSVFLWVSGTELRLPALSGKLCPLSHLTWS